MARLCRRVGGLPLAIEQAAARVRVLSADQIVAGLDDVFGLLVGGTRGAPARHQSLHATLDWSHDLLTGPEQVVFRRLGVFPGSFTLSAAERVASGGDIAAADVLDLISRLVDRSLVVAQPWGEQQVRYRLLSPIRDYARERLAAAGERSSVAAVHLECYAELVERAQPRLSGPEQVAELTGWTSKATTCASR